MINREYEDNLNKHKDKLFLESIKMSEEMKEDKFYEDEVVAFFRNSGIVSESDLYSLKREVDRISYLYDDRMKKRISYLKAYLIEMAIKHFQWSK